jgi:acetolactate synthase I/II/III large subunit
MRVSDYIANALVSFGVRDVFMVTGGGAMHLNDAIGRNPSLNVVCCHHEQTCTMAAESYFRITNKIAAVCVTTGPGGTNAITGVYGAYVDSMAMLVISGQVKWETLVRSTNLPLRQLGDQEVDIIKLVESVTKYSVIITDPNSIRYHIERAIYLSTSGRPGPVWLDIPINVQSSDVDPLNLKGYNPAEELLTPKTGDIDLLVNDLIKRIRSSKRPVIYAGSGIRLSKQYDNFLVLIQQLGVPVVTAWNSNDLLADDNEVYAGRPGSIGNRTGNFVVQNADFLLILGCRLNIRLVSYNWKSFAPNAFKAMVDIDSSELKKPTVKIDLPINEDLRDVIPKMLALTTEWQKCHSEWLNWAKSLLHRFPVILSEYWESNQFVNPYCFVGRLFEKLGEDEIIVCGDGTACVTAFQAAVIRKGQRLFHNSGCASMGYDLPAAIGAAVASPKNKRIICLAGDGSIMMNLQEMQTIVGNKYPVKIFILNNNGYHSIRQTQASFFPDKTIGCGPESGLSFPDFGKIAIAFGYSYIRCDKHIDLDSTIQQTLDGVHPAVCELMLDLNQNFSPKLSSRKLNDGSMVTASLEDMAPFIETSQMESIMRKGKE